MALDFLAGCVGGSAGVVVGYPLDTVKVRLQMQDPKNPTYRGTFHCLRTIVQQESTRGLFKGMSSPMASVAVINALIFGVYGNVQRRLSDPNSLRSHALAGSIAGLAQSVVCSPMELIKTRIQVQTQLGTEIYKGPVDCVRQIWRSEGTRGIFRGLGITVVREIPSFAIYFASYEAMTRQDDPMTPISTLHMMAAGGMAGTFSWLFTYPIDFLKSRLQVDGLVGPAVYKGIGDCIAQTYRDEGVRGFFRGMPSTLIRSFPVNATTFTVVTWMLRWASSDNSESSVTYQETAALVQESLAATATFAQDHRHVAVANDSAGGLVTDWNSLGLHIGLYNPTTAANYAIAPPVDWSGPVSNTFKGSATKSKSNDKADQLSVPCSCSDDTKPPDAIRTRDEAVRSHCSHIQATATTATTPVSAAMTER